MNDRRDEVVTHRGRDALATIRATDERSECAKHSQLRAANEVKAAHKKGQGSPSRASLTHNPMPTAHTVQKTAVSTVIIEMELVGMRTQSDLVDLLFTFPLNPRLDKVVAKDAALGEELMVLLERLHGLFE